MQNGCKRHFRLTIEQRELLRKLSWITFTSYLRISIPDEHKRIIRRPKRIKGLHCVYKGTTKWAFSVCVCVCVHPAASFGEKGTANCMCREHRRGSVPLTKSLIKEKISLSKGDVHHWNRYLQTQSKNGSLGGMLQIFWNLSILSVLPTLTSSFTHLQPLSTQSVHQLLSNSLFNKSFSFSFAASAWLFCSFCVKNKQKNT